jgi:hypothetical protein
MKNKVLMLMMAVLLLAVLPVLAGEKNKQAEELLKQGSDLFKQANELSLTDAEAARDLYKKSVMRLEKVVNDYGIENGKIFYNIGNTYFRMEDIGNAILNYRRAEKYMPRDVNLMRNLSYAQARRVDSFDERQSSKILKTFFFWHYDLSAKVRMICFVLVFTLIWVFALVRLFIKSSFLNWGIGLSAVLSLVLFVSLTADYVQSRLVKHGVITAREVIARKGDSKTYEPTFKQPLHAGTEFVLKSDRGDWLQVELTDGSLCWLPQDSIGME